MNKYLKTLLVLLLSAGIFYSCDSVLEPSVDQEKLTDEAINTVDDLQAFVYSIHDIYNRIALYGRDYPVTLEVMSDNAFSNDNSGRFIVQSQFNYTVNSGYANGLWNGFYAAIANANVIINSEADLSGPRVDHIKGQAYAMRALSHMNLILSFGQQWVNGGDPANGVPYVTTYNEGDLYPVRTPISTVWSNIESDFNTAESLMDPSFDDEVAIIGYYAVKALQSRMYLYTGDFGAAITAADEVINSGLYDLVDAANLAAAWASGSGPSSIFEIGYTDTDRSGNDSIARIYRDTNYGDVEATEDLYLAYEADDVRLDLFDVDGDVYRMAFKYVDELGSDNVRVIRYAEVLLNKAEALARRNQGTDQAEALLIINELSADRGSSRVYASGTPENVLAERRLELAMEGHRLFDLARHGLDVTNVFIPARGRNFNDGNDITFGDYRYSLPIPNAEMNANPNMVQNEGYN
jgi:starch-binding outer membrane protein, SusD/RagB family